MTEAQLRLALQARLQHFGFMLADVAIMTPTQMRTALASVCPGLWTSEELKAMDEDELREQLSKRLRAGVRYFDRSDIECMDNDQLRAVIRTYWPDLISDEEITRMSRQRLQKKIWNLRALAMLGPAVVWVC